MSARDRARSASDPDGANRRPARARSVARTEGVEKSRALQRVLYRCAKQDPHRRFHALYQHVARSDILQRAWGEVRANRGAPGADGVTIDAVEESGVDEFLSEIAAALKGQSYRPAPLRRVDIPKAKPGEYRTLSIPTVCDRVVMTAAKIVLEAIFEADFLPSSFGFRPGRSAHQALEVVRVEANRGREWVLDADISDCFGSLSHDALMAEVARRVSDRACSSCSEPGWVPGCSGMGCRPILRREPHRARRFPPCSATWRCTPLIGSGSATAAGSGCSCGMRTTLSFCAPAEHGPRRPSGG